MTSRLACTHKRDWFLTEVITDHPQDTYDCIISEEIAAEAISAGVTDSIQKEPGPSQYAVLANRVQNAVEARRDELQATRGHRAMNAAWDGISTLYDEGRFTYLNDAYAATFGSLRVVSDTAPVQ